MKEKTKNLIGQIVLGVVITLCIMTTEAFVMLKLFAGASMSWWWVWSPLWLPVVLLLVWAVWAIIHDIIEYAKGSN